MIALLGLSACADDSALTSTAGADSATDPTTTSGSPDASESPASGETAQSSGGSAGGALTVDFTVESSSTGMGGPGGGRNPYIAVWVETSGGDFVQTIALWHLQGGQDRWLSEMFTWYQASGGVETNSGATRAAGDYSVGWDLTDADGNAVAAGDYELFIEGNREHGHYELLQTTITVGSDAASGDLEPNGDITAASWTFQP